MYTLSLEIESKCNLNCKYCYLGKKKNSEMDLLTAKSAIDLGIREAIKQYDKTILVYFAGGEPLLRFEFIKELVDYINIECKKNNLKPMYSLTTNGTLLNQSNIMFLLINNFTLKVSLDGIKESHDINRKHYDGSGSYEEVLSNIKLLIKKRKEVSNSESVIQIANVITKNNYKFLKENIEHIYDIGIIYIETGVDNYVTWDRKSLLSLKDEVYRAFEYYKYVNINIKRVYWSLFENSIGRHLRSACFYSCKAGLKSIFVTVDGRMFPCVESDDNLCIGNIYSGLDVNKIRRFVSITETQNKKCFECQHYKHCNACSCIMENYKQSGDFYKPIEVQCFLTKTLNDIISKEFTFEQVSTMKG